MWEFVTGEPEDALYEEETQEVCNKENKSTKEFAE